MLLAMFKPVGIFHCLHQGGSGGCLLPVLCYRAQGMVVQLPTVTASHPATLASGDPLGGPSRGMGKPGSLYNSGNHAPKGHKLSSDEFVDMVQQSLSRNKPCPGTVLCFWHMMWPLP